MSVVLPRKILVFVSLTLVALMFVGGLPNAPALADPCSATSGAAGIANRVCLDQRTIHEADGAVEDVAVGAHAGVTFVTFDVARASDVVRRAVVSRDDATWSAALPAGDGLGLRALGTAAWATDAVAVDAGSYRLIHLVTPMLPEWHAALAQAGATVHAYVPVNHFVVRLAADPSTLDALPFVDAVDVVAPDAKVEPGLVEEGGIRKVNILYWPGASGAREATLDALALLDAQVVQDAAQIERIQAWVRAADLPALAAVPDVMWIDRAGEGPMEHDMEKIRQMVGADHVLGQSVPFDGTGVVGQVMDSELDLNHPDFQASLLVDYSHPQNPAGNHGSSVYGIVFGDGTGNNLAAGMAPGAKGTFAQYFSNTRYHYAQRVAQDYGGVFQTHSWGNPVPKDNTYDSFSNENDRVVHELDVLMLQSMSNCGPQCARREAMAKNILSIGALVHFDSVGLSDDKWNNGASTGPAADGRIKPELVGPYDSIRTTVRGGYTTGFGGTSGATPVVAGAVALTHQMAGAGVFSGVGPGLEPATAKALLIASAHTYDPQQVLTGTHTNPPSWLAEPYKRDVQGWGLPALQTLYDNAPNATVLDGTAALETGDSHAITLTMPVDATRVHVTLAWTDLPASPGASPTLVNDLDLTVTVHPLPVGLFRGNFGLDQSTVNLPGGVADERNNVENVFLHNVAGLPITVTVHGTAVNLDADPSTPEIDQPFSLVVLPIV